MKNFIGLCILLLFVNSCTVGPNYQRPTVQIPAHYKEAPSGWKFAEPNDSCSAGKWWMVFNDEQLNALEERVDISNQNIKAAFAQYMQAKALVTQARSAYFPLISGFGSVTREKSATSSALSSTAVSGLSPGTGSTPNVGKPFNNYHLELDASWAPDLWGSVRRTAEGAVAGAQASRAQVAATQLLTEASLAQFYFELRGLDGDQSVLDDTVRNYQKLLSITQNQYKVGTASRAAVLQAKSLLELAQVQAIDNGILRAQYEHAIAVLIGIPPSAFCIEVNHTTYTPPLIPAELPSTLLERRPDIAQAERLVKQANAQVGVAIAAYFPVLTLTETGGYNATKLANLFSKPAQFWSIGAQLADTLFDGGFRSGQVEEACALLRQAVAQYRQTVLTAFQDVEDNLAALRILNDEMNKQNQAANTANEALKVTLNEYKAGTLGLADVLNAEITLYTAQKGVNDIAYRQMVAAVNLIRALGGGWNMKEMNTNQS